MSDSEAPRDVTEPVDTSRSQVRRNEETVWGEIQVDPLYIGMAATMIDDETVKIGISMHVGIVSIENYTSELTLLRGENMQDVIQEYITHTLETYSTSNNAKFVGAGITLVLETLSPRICAHIWKKLDVVCVLLEMQTVASDDYGDSSVDVAEQADSAARECVRRFDEGHNPALVIRDRNRVMPDAEGAIKTVDGLGEYKNTIHEPTWNTVLKYASELRGYNHGQTEEDPDRPPIKIAFFSATPQGGGVALMRHALVRFCSELGVDLSWFVPIISMVNSIYLLICVTGVANSEERFDAEKQSLLNEWMRSNAERYWLTPGGPLAPGGADVVVIDDPQMPALIPLIKMARPEVKIIYRSHIEVRKDLVERVGSTQEQVWQWIWDYVKEADVFISHPVDKFVPHNVPFNMIGLMPACTDWLDGLNKPLGEWDLKFYHRNLHNLCNEQKTNHLLYPARDYITQIARFDPSKGIPEVIESYRKLCNRIINDAPERLPPQLLICGHGAIDDPDAEMVFARTIELLKQPSYSAIAKDVVVARIGPSDQILNAMITTAKIVLQLSLREGFEVKVSEALYHGKPVVATRAGGIPLQIQHGKSGFLVEVGDTDSVANHLFDLYTDNDLYTQMSRDAKASVSDEVGTVGNAACWLYLVAKLARGENLQPQAQWIMDMAMEEAGQKYEIGQPILPRSTTDFKVPSKS
ncbi:trehalose synthase [Tuber indicum]|nr:trehalose synthase [Tuber indicum]